MIVEQLTSNGISSYNDFKLYIRERILSPPVKRSNIQTVIGMHGSYDFSKIYGEVVWEDRTIEYKFDVISDNNFDLYSQLTKIYNWLCNIQDSNIYDTCYPNYHFRGSYQDATWSEDDGQGLLTVKFKIYPFKISNNTISSSFEITSTAKQEVMIINSSSHRISPKIRTTGYIAIENGNGNILLNAGEWAVEDFYLEKGTNILKISGPATVTFSYSEEVF